MNEDRIETVVNKFFDALKQKDDYTIEGTGLTFHTTIDLLKASSKEEIKNKPEKFENLVKCFVNASMYLLNDIEELAEIDVQLRNAG